MMLRYEACTYSIDIRSHVLNLSLVDIDTFSYDKFMIDQILFPLDEN